MKLLNSQQIHEWDAFTIASEPVASIDLMERAARKCTEFITDNYADAAIKIFCAKGNNGGDGLAIARQLIEQGINPVIYILELGAMGTPDFQANLHRLHELTTDIHFIQSNSFFPGIDKNDIVVDALYGSGLNRPLQQLSEALVHHINDAKATVIAIDVPSGMFIDKSSKGNAVIKATHTLTFQTLKLCLLVAENEDLFGTIAVLDIGLDPAFPATAKAIFYMPEHAEIAAIYQPRKAFSHKGSFGHSLLIAGNPGKMGAALLAAKACACTGSGLLTVGVPENFTAVLNTYLPEAMTLVRNEKIAYAKYNAVGIGPGLGTGSECKALLQDLLQQYNKPIVFDADALNMLALEQEMLQKIPAGSILTPHPKEFDRLAGESANDFERISKALALSQQLGCVIVLKGHHSLITFNGQGWFNSTGNAGLAKGGSGDVLTGMITALLAQGYNGLNAAILAVYLHGLSADIASKSVATEAMLASDVIEHISDAFFSIQV